MSRLNMDITGMDELMSYFDSVGDDAQKVEKDAVKAGGEVIKRYQERNWNRSNKNQEHIQDNIEVGRVTQVAEGTQTRVRPKSSLLWRAKFVEYGTSKMAAQAPIEKSGQQGESEAYEAMMKEFEGVIDG